MKIVYFYQYFSTPKGAWGTRVYEFTKDWVNAGHDVTVITSVYAKSDINANKLVDNQYFDGILVKVLNIQIDNKKSFFRRIFSFISYSILSSYYALTLPADVVIASSGPITAWIPGILAKYFRKKKLVLEVRDLWPEGAIELGIIKNKFLKFLSLRFEKHAYDLADGIVTLSPGMSQIVQKKVPSKKVVSVTNAANIGIFNSREYSTLEGLTPQKYAVYTGNIGEVNNSIWLLNTAFALKSKGREDLSIVLLGDGQQKNELVEKAEVLGLTNFLYLGLKPKLQMIPILQNAMVSLVPLKNSPILDTSSPNKFFESLAAGVPVIQNTNGWMKEFLVEHNAGITVPSGDASFLADLLIHLDNHPQIRNQLSINAKEAALLNFDKAILSKKMLDFILSCVESKTN